MGVENEIRQRFTKSDSQRTGLDNVSGDTHRSVGKVATGTGQRVDTHRGESADISQRAESQIPINLDPKTEGFKNATISHATRGIDEDNTRISSGSSRTQQPTQQRAVDRANKSSQDNQRDVGYYATQQVQENTTTQVGKNLTENQVHQVANLKHLQVFD